MRLFVSTGEASGDAYGAALIREFDRIVPGKFLYEGLGGAKMAAQNIKIIRRNEKWGAMGILESLRVTPQVLQGYWAAKSALSHGEPGLFIAVDFGYMNIRLMKAAKARGWRTMYFIPPGSWRKDRQGADLPAIADAVVTPFPWSAEILRNMGANAHFFGHPLKQLVPTPVGDRTALGILPGSRIHEITCNSGPILKSIEGLTHLADVSVAPTVSDEFMRRMWPPDVKLSSDGGSAVLARSRAAIVCSGTATLEAALSGCPCVVMYRGTKLMELEYKLLKPKFDYVSLPNILLERKILPELIQDDASPEAIRRELMKVWEDGKDREAQLSAYAELRDLLGPADAITKTVELACSMV